MRRAAKIDANQTQIVSALRAAGAFVQSLGAVGAGCPDLLVGSQGQTFLMEVKIPKVKGKLRPQQEEWHDSWNGGVLLTVETPEQALQAIGAIHVSK